MDLLTECLQLSRFLPQHDLAVLSFTCRQFQVFRPRVLSWKLHALCSPERVVWAENYLGFVYKAWMAMKLAQYGYFTTILWLVKNRSHQLTHLELEIAAFQGCLPAVVALYEAGSPICSSACEIAADRGHTQLLSWLQGNGVLWNNRLRIFRQY